jgi:hypothetical protein
MLVKYKARRNGSEGRTRYLIRRPYDTNGYTFEGQIMALGVELTKDIMINVFGSIGREYKDLPDKEYWAKTMRLVENEYGGEYEIVKIVELEASDLEVKTCYRGLEL